MKKIINQAGLTLIEVLATITILSIVSVTIYSVISNGLRYSSQAEDTVLIQQETNYIITLLKEQHENSDAYKVTIDKDGQTLIINEGLPNEIDATNPKYEYQLCDEESYSCGGFEKNTSFIKTIHPKDTVEKVEGDIYGNFHFKIILRNKENHKIIYDVKTILSRL